MEEAQILFKRKVHFTCKAQLDILFSVLGFISIQNEMMLLKQLCWDVPLLSLWRRLFGSQNWLLLAVSYGKGRWRIISTETLNSFYCYNLFVFGHYIVQAGLEFIILPLPFVCWDYRHMPLHPAYCSTLLISTGRY